MVNVHVYVSHRPTSTKVITHVRVRISLYIDSTPYRSQNTYHDITVKRRLHSQIHVEIQFNMDLQTAGDLLHLLLRQSTDGWSLVPGNGVPLLHLLQV